MDIGGIILVGLVGLIIVGLVIWRVTGRRP